MPDRNDEYLLYQILLGAWPLAVSPQPESPWGMLLPPGEQEEYAAFAARIGQYMNKAIKEAKVHGSWINPDEAYDRATQDFIAALLRPGPENRFLPAFAPLARRVAFFGQVNALSQVALKLTVPGMPDTYQGNELWDFSLVDPDNRRPVDYALRQALLAGPPPRGATEPGVVSELLERSHDGGIKLFLTSRLLDLRKARPELFDAADYLPLETRGQAANHVIAFARQARDSALVVIVPRLTARLAGAGLRWPVGDVWGDTAVLLPEGLQGRAFADALTGAEGTCFQNRLVLSDALRVLPLAVLVG
jgi:(1->4)-alpha-D-glucan 1-alpha-D-glucosylmutase